MKKSDIEKDGRINDKSQFAYIRRYTINGGAEDGLKVIECNNGKTRFLLNESKALDIMQIFYLGENTSFVSKNGFTARETAFSNRFEGGALYTCGLDAVGGVEGKEIHGRFHNIPAEIIRAEAEEDGLTVEAEIKYTALFDENIVVKRRVFSPYASGEVELTDEILNRGGREEELCLLYHVNIGYPLLDEGGRIKANVDKVTPRTEWAKQNLNNWDRILAPIDRVEENCFYITPKDRKVSYINEKTGRKFTLSYCNEIDKVIIWKSWQRGDYSLGIEPTTTFLDENFRYFKLVAKANGKFGIRISIE